MRKQRKQKKQKITSYDICKKILLVLVVISLCMHSVQWAASITYDETIEVSNNDELQIALETIRNDSSGTKNYLIKLTADIETQGMSFNKNEVTILGQGHTLSFVPTQAIPETTIGISGTAVVNLGSENGKDTLIIKGHKTNDVSFIDIDSVNALVNMYDGTTIKDQVTNNYFGGAVAIKHGTFHMYGGTIQGCGIDGGSVCAGGAVAVLNGSVFIMDGGTIKNCFVKTDFVPDSNMIQDSNSMYYSWKKNYPTCVGGGVFVTGNSAFIMNGGEILNCSSTGNVSASGGGVAICSTTQKNVGSQGTISAMFQMNGGKIDGCSATNTGGGILATGYYHFASAMLNPEPAQTNNKYKVGVYIHGGTISNNTISEQSEAGAGIALYYFCRYTNTPAEIKNCKIIGNKAQGNGYGGGISIIGSWTKTIIDNCIISDNASEVGGGIMLCGNSPSGYTKISNTSITNNKAKGEFTGGGINFDNYSKLIMQGKDVVQDNKSLNEQGEEVENNVYIWSPAYPVYIGGDLQNSKIGLSDDNICCDEPTSFVRLTQDYKSQVGDVRPYTYFTSDHDGWYPDFGQDERVFETQIRESETYETWSECYAVPFMGYIEDSFTKAQTVGKYYFKYDSKGNYTVQTSSTGAKELVVLAHEKGENKKLWLAYCLSSNSSYVLIKELTDYTPFTNYSLSEIKEITGLEFPADSGVNFIRSRGMSDGNLTQNFKVYTLGEQQVLKSGVDYSNEVKLYQSGKIKLTKTSSNNDNTKITGAEFTIYNKNSEGTYSDSDKVKLYEKNGEVISGYECTKLTDSNGEIEFKGLLQGEYVIKETNPANGYSINENYYDIKIDDDNLNKNLKVTNELIDYKITYVLNGGANSDENPHSYNVQSETIELKDAEKKHYDFKGWYSDEEFTNQVSQIETGSHGDITLYAKWEGERYAVRLHTNDGIIADGHDVTEYAYDKETLLPSSIYITKDGYKFKGWYENEKFSGKPVTKIEKFQTGDKDFYAKWEKVEEQEEPIEDPEEEPTEDPEKEPEEEPTEDPEKEPEEKPTEDPEKEPEEEPTEEPEKETEEEPTENPEKEPEEKPTEEQTKPESGVLGDSDDEEDNEEPSEKPTNNKVTENVKTGDTIVKYVDILIICIGLYMISFKIKIRKSKH